MSRETTRAAPSTRERAPGSGEDSVLPEAGVSFVSSPYVEQVARRALAYLVAGYPVHFCGVAGTGKTTLAFHVASKLGRPVTLVQGDDEFGSSDLVGRDGGYRKQKLVDNFIHSVLKTEEETRNFWVDNRLTTACQNGETFIYDEFNRSRPEANNALLSVLSEGILNLPKLRQSGEGLPGRASAVPRHLHLQSRGVRRGAQDPGRLDGPPDHHPPGTL